MTGPQQSHNPMASSPNSADSYTYGTPSTVPTVISPEHSTGSKGKGKAPAHGNVNSASSEQRNNQAFERPTRRNVPAPIHVPSRQQLSPTADVFTPGTALDGGLFPRTPTNPNNAGNGRVRNAMGVAELSPGHPGVIGQPSNATTSPYVLDDGAWFNPGTVIREGTFTIQENYARAFAVIGVNTNPGQLAAAFSPDRFKSLVHIDTRDLAQGTFSVEFSDIRDAKQAWALVAHMAPGATIFKLPPMALAARHPNRAPATSDHDGEYVVSLVPFRVTQQQGIPTEELATFLNFFGDLLAVHSIDPYDDATMALRVEYFDLADGLVAFNALNGATIHGFRVIVQAYSRVYNGHSSRSTPARRHGPAHYRQAYNDPQNYGQARNIPNPQRDGYTRQAFIEYQSAMLSRFRQRPSTGNNHVDIYRILAGNDVRTTIMLRNIPNRINQDALKALLDRTSRGDYDFMYLRIDFANNCNVGYAFINFVDPMAIVPFARARAGQRWNVFNSDKVAEISYATIQGRDCLIQKFRNSSVMLEKGSFRPKLYRTGSGPDAGTEEPFPPPDNMSKLKRSCENAAHIGLYIPTLLSHIQALHQPCPPPRNQAAGGFYAAPIPRRQALAHANLPLTPSSRGGTSTFVSPSLEDRLYAPRESQAHRERAHRQHSQFDRGTPGAEFEARTHAVANTPSSGASFGFDESANSSPFNLSGFGSALPNDVFTDGRGAAEARHNNGSFFTAAQDIPDHVVTPNTVQGSQPPRPPPGNNQNPRPATRGPSNFNLAKFLGRPFNHEE